MSFPVFIEQRNAQFVATLMGLPGASVTATTRDGALAEIRTILQDRLALGEIVFLDLPKQGIASFAGRYKDDPTLIQICADIYRQRDAEPKE